MVRMSYPRELRDSVVRQMIGPEGLSAHELSRRTGIARQTLCRWRTDALSVVWMESHEDESQRELRLRPQDWTPQEKLRVVLEAAALDDESLGAFLRREGLHEAQLIEWRETAMGSAIEGLKGKPHRAPGKSKRERALERELRRKDKALAETTALLVLRGKLDALLGEEGDDTSES